MTIVRPLALRLSPSRLRVCTALLAMAAAVPANTHAQQPVSVPQQQMRVEVGKSLLLPPFGPIERVVVSSPEVLDVQILQNPDGSPTGELLLRGVSLGTTSFFVWVRGGGVRMFNVEVTPDVTTLQAQLDAIFPTEDLNVSAIGNSLIISGQTRDPAVVRRALLLAQQTGAQVINDIQAPTAEQILLHVRFAEIRKTALNRLSSDLFFQNIGALQGVVEDGSVANLETLAEGIVRLSLLGQESQLDAVIRALKSQGELRSLAEPNLITLEGQEATFLAGGEFPFPTVQAAGAGAASTAVTVQFKEFGVRLTFTPNVTNSGTIRLTVAPEVSTLDFANGLTISGFQIPSLLTRRATTQVELAPGQHLAIAGLLDNNTLEAVDKIPLLGDLPIIGALFRARLNQQDRTELLVLVTPYIVEPLDVAPQLPTGEPRTWRWNRNLRPDTTNVMPHVRRRGN